MSTGSVCAGSQLSGGCQASTHVTTAAEQCMSSGWNSLALPPNGVGDPLLYDALWDCSVEGTVYLTGL